MRQTIVVDADGGARRNVRDVDPRYRGRRQRQMRQLDDDRIRPRSQKHWQKDGDGDASLSSASQGVSVNNRKCNTAVPIGPRSTVERTELVSTICGRAK